MPIADHDGVKIYYRIEGSGPDLFLAHGLSSTGEDWRELGYVARLRGEFRLILVDARGHGRSGKPHDPQVYSPEARVKDYVAILDQLGVFRAYYWGYSSGGIPGFCLAKYAPERFSAVVIGGLDPYPASRDIGDRSPPNPKPMRGLTEGDDPIRTALEGGGDAWLRFWESNTEVPDGMKARQLANDFQALIALWENPYSWRDEIAGLLPEFPVPCLLYAGDGEASYRGMQAAAEEMPRANFIPLPGCGHFDIWMEPDVIIPHVMKFLKQ